MSKEHKSSQVLMIHSRPVFVEDKEISTFICTGLDYLRIPDDRLHNVASKRFIRMPVIVPYDGMSLEEMKSSFSEFKDNFAIQRMRIVLDDIAAIAHQCPNALIISADTIFKNIWYSDDPDYNISYANSLLSAPCVSGNVPTDDPEIFKNCGYVHAYQMIRKVVDRAICAFSNLDNQENPVDAYLMECHLEFILGLIRRERRKNIQDAV